MILKFKTEILISSLLLATFAIILANKVILRSHELTVLNAASVGYADDRESGGTSEASAKIDGDFFKFNYKIGKVPFTKNYSLISICLGETFPSDLSWVDRFEITSKTSRPQGEHVTFNVKDFDPTVSVEENPTSQKYNETLLRLSNQLETVTVHRDDFFVPTWWQQKFNVKGKAAKPSFKNVTSFDFNANTTGSGEIEIASVRCVGQWFDGATLNQSLLWMWMGGTLIGIIFRMLKLKKKLDDKTVSALELQAHNELLVAKSATYYELAHRDPLTGLLNRYGLQAEFDELSSKGNFDYAVLLFDLDKFKEINDNLGHSYGDRVLFDVATIVRSKLGDKDIFARWGGDEFLVILGNRTVEEASSFAEDVRELVLASDLIYSCSFGICKSEVDCDFESTFSKADSAMYESKNNGRDKITSYRNKRRRRSVDWNTITSPEITLPPNDMCDGEFTIYQ